MICEALFDVQLVFYYGSTQRKLKLGLNKTGTNSFDHENRLFGEIDGFLYLAVSMNQIDYCCF